jgi:hypothetical protein
MTAAYEEASHAARGSEEANPEEDHIEVRQDLLPGYMQDQSCRHEDRDLVVVVRELFDPGHDLPGQSEAEEGEERHQDAEDERPQSQLSNGGEGTGESDRRGDSDGSGQPKSRHPSPKKLDRRAKDRPLRTMPVHDSVANHA